MLTYTCIIILVYSVMTENIDANVVTQGEQICAYFKSGGKEQNISKGMIVKTKSAEKVRVKGYLRYKFIFCY